MPTPDAKITADEYAWSYEAVFANDATDNNFLLRGAEITGAEKASKVTYYMSSDSDYVYFAAALEDANAVGQDGLHIQITAGDDLTKNIRYYLEVVNGVKLFDNNLNLDKSDPSKFYTSTGTHYHIVNGTRLGINFEIKIARETLMDIFDVDSLDKLLVTMSLCYNYVDGVGSSFAVWGFDNETLAEAGIPKHPTGSAYPNVVNLAESLITITKDPYDLSEYGQKTESLTEAFTPFVDGLIDEGEYELVIDATLANDAADNNFYIYGDKTMIADAKAEGAKFYLASDDENIYIACEQTDAIRAGGVDVFFVQIGTDTTNSFLQYYIPYHGNVELLDNGGRPKAAGVREGYYYLYATSMLEGKNIYEIAIPREVIKDEFEVDSLDKILISLSQMLHNEKGKGNLLVTWGFQNGQIGGTHGAQQHPIYGYPHVLELYTPSGDSGEELPDEPVSCDTHSFGEWTASEGVASRECNVCHTIETSADYSYSGVCGEGLVWFIDKATATLTVVGEGAMADFTFENDAPWYAYRSNIGAVVISEGVTSVGDYAFFSHYPISKVTLASTVASIGENAFCGAKLESVELVEGLTTIESFAFENCGSLKAVTIPASVTTIGANPFYACGALETLTVVEGNENYTTSANCLIDTAKATIIAAAADATLDEVVGATAIGYVCFAGRRYETFNIPAFIENIDSTAFAASAITTLTVDAENEIYAAEGNCLMEKATSTVVKGFDNSTIPESATAIGSLAFAGTAITSLNIPASVKTIGELAFAGCDLLESVHIPSGVTEIGLGAFARCVSLKRIGFAGSASEWKAINKSEFWSGEATYQIVYGVSEGSGGAGHEHVADPEIVPGKEPTCTETGLTNGIRCISCSEMIVPQEEIPMTPHNYALSTDNGNGTHTRRCSCGAEITGKHVYITGKLDCASCGAAPETIFELGGVGQKTEYLGEIKESTPNITEYITVASVADFTETSGNSEHFYWDNVNTVTGIELLAAYTADILHLAVEVVDTNHDGVMVFTIKTEDEERSFEVSSSSIDGDSILYTLDRDRETLEVFVRTSSGVNNEFVVSARYTSGEQVVNVGAQSSGDVGDLTQTGDNVGIALVLESAPAEEEIPVLPEDPEEPEEVVRLGITWDSGFVFEYAIVENWDTGIHGNVEEGYWKLVPMSVTVTNESTFGVTTSMQFVPVENTDNVKDIEGVIVDTVTNDRAVLEALEKNNNYATTLAVDEQKTVYLYIVDGEVLYNAENSNKIGTVTITLTETNE